MILLCKVRMVGWLGDKDEGKMIFQAPRQYSLFLHLALRASPDLLINVTHGWRAAAGAALQAHDTLLSTPIPPSNWQLGCYLPVSEILYMEALLSEPFPSPRIFSPARLAFCYALGLPSACTHFLTSPAGNGSCPDTIILFSWSSALISLPQLVSGPEAKGTQKGKQCRTTLGSDMLN